MSYSCWVLGKCWKVREHFEDDMKLVTRLGKSFVYHIPYFLMILTPHLVTIWEKGYPVQTMRIYNLRIARNSNFFNFVTTNSKMKHLATKPRSRAIR